VKLVGKRRDFGGEKFDVRIFDVRIKKMSLQGTKQSRRNAW